MAIKLFCWLKTRRRGGRGSPPSNCVVAPGGGSTRPGCTCASITLNFVPCRTRRFRQLFELHCLLERKFPYRRALDFLKMRSASQLLSHFMRQRADIRPGRTLDDEPGDAALDLVQLELKQFDLHRF